MTLEQYRRRLGAFLAERVAGGDRATYGAEERRALTAALYDAGLSAVTWPVAYGGQGLGADFQTVFNEATAEYEWALQNVSVTVGICAPTILEFGTEEQRRRHLPAMLRGDEAWTQLLSEPGAGSDLGSVVTRARRDGDEWVVTGQKVWTSAAVQSHFAIALVRTDPELPRYRGLSMLVMDMRASGVDIRPLREMTGEALFNEVFLDDVRVPATNLLGAVNEGWTVLGRMLFHERMALSAGTTGGRMDRDAFAELSALARDHAVAGEPAVRAVLAELYIQQRLMDLLGQRMRAAAETGSAMGPVGSIGKIGSARSARLGAEAGMLIAGAAGQAWPAGDDRHEAVARYLLFFPMTGIAGGTTEIQKNIVAERVLGLPRDPRSGGGTGAFADVGGRADEQYRDPIPDVLDERRHDLRDVVRSFVERAALQVRAVMESQAGYDPQAWRTMASQIGLVGIAIPERYSGAGGDLVDLALVQHELGRGLVPSPFLSTSGFAAPLLQALGDEAACGAYLPTIAKGTCIATVALADREGGWEVQPDSVWARPADGSWRLSGERWYVTDALAADVVLVPVAGPDGLSVFAVDAPAPGLTRTALRTLDLTRRQGVVSFSDTPARLVGRYGAAGPALSAARRVAILALVAEQTGGADFLLGLSVRYARLRQQFGRPIGSFQAVKHKLADMAFDVERMRSAVAQLAKDLASDGAAAPVLAHLAKAYCSEAYFRVAAENIQIHGGIGFTWEHVSHLYFRRAKSTEYLLGGPAEHRDRMVSLLDP